MEKKNIYNIVSGNVHVLHLKWVPEWRQRSVYVPKLPVRTAAARHRQAADVLDDGEAATPHSGKTKSPASLKGKLGEGGIQFHLPFSTRPPGTRE